MERLKIGTRRKDGMYLRGHRKNGSQHWVSERSWLHRKQVIKAAVKRSSARRDADPLRKAEHRKKAAKGMREKRAQDPIKMRCYQLAYRAKKNGRVYNLNPEKIKRPRKCPLLGLTLEYNVKGKAVDCSASVDRIDSTKGYTMDNVWIVSWRANRLKSDATLKELILLTKNLEKKLESRQSSNSQWRRKI